ncbi:MAG: transposase [Euzebya sp.]
MDDAEEIIAQLRVDASSRQVDQLLAWAPAHPDRVWAVENAHGMGHLLTRKAMAQEILADWRWLNRRIPAPLKASSGDVIRHRLSRRGDQQMNKVLHVAATCQARRRQSRPHLLPPQDR